MARHRSWLLRFGGRMSWRRTKYREAKGHSHGCPGRRRCEVFAHERGCLSPTFCACSCHPRNAENSASAPIGQWVAWDRLLGFKTVHEVREMLR